jgi:FkbM family methyltransferase
MKIYILPIDSQFQPETSRLLHPPHNSDYGVEQDFFQYLHRNPQLVTDNPNEADWHYLPVYWTRYYINHNLGETDLSELQQSVDSFILSDSKTFTICQYDDGPLVNLGATINFLSSRRTETGVDIPLLCSFHRIPEVKPSKKYLTTFMGFLHHHSIRQEMFETIKYRNDLCMATVSTEIFVERTLESYLVLCPRGYGGSSFRFFESMQLGVAPLMISDIDTRPFKEFINWNEISLFTNSATSLNNLLDSLNKSELLEMGQRAEDFYKEKLYYQKWCTYVMKYLASLKTYTGSNNMISLLEKIDRHAKEAEAVWGLAYPLFGKAIAHKDLKIGVEIGVAFGGHSESILQHTSVEKLYGVDPYLHMEGYADPMNLPQEEFDALYNYIQQRFATFGERYQHIRQLSKEAINEIVGEVDFVYIDADHSYKGVWDDLCIWYPKVKIGGIIGGHDYDHPAFAGVKQAIDEFFKPLNFQIHVEGEGVWWVEKQPVNISQEVPGWQENAYNLFCTIVENKKLNTGAPTGEAFDVAYIDELSYQGLWNQLCNWYGKVKSGAVIGGCGYDRADFPGIKNAVNEFFRRFKSQVHTPGESVWWIEKPPTNISFFIPAYNCEETIEESVDSILKGNFEHGDELIIVNDCSTDNTESLLEGLKIKYPFINIFRHETNKGGGSARNTAVQNASHSLLFCLDSDNILVPGSIQKLKEFLINSGADVAAFQEIHFFERSKENIINKWIYQDQISLADFFSRHDVPGASGNYLFTKESWMRAGGYPESSGALDTHSFGFRQLATGSKMLTLPNTYYSHRQGIESYFVKFSRTNNSSLILADSIAPFAYLIADADWQYMCGEGRDNWYENINQRPIYLRNEAKSMQTEAELQPVAVLQNNEEKNKQSRNRDTISDGESQVIAKFINAGNVVFDVGANAGDWTTEVLGQGHNVEIHLFEPIPQVYQTLTQNLDKKLIFNNIAVGKKEEVNKFYYYESNSPLSTFYRRVDVEKQGLLDTPNEITVLKTTIDRYCQRHGLKRINFLKIDAGGSELDILYGANHFLQTGRIDYLQFEYGGTFIDAKTRLRQIFDYLQKFRYSIFKILPDRLEYKPTFLPEDENFEFSNFLAVNERFRQNVLGEALRMLDLQQIFSQYGIVPHGVIHVGAHEGTEISNYQAMGVQKVLFVEANPVVFERLEANLTGVSNVQAVNCAVSNQNGTINLRVTSMDQSSSILQLKRHLELYPNIQETHQVTVDSKTIDTLLQEMQLNPYDFNILNIDIQGAELLALQGATNWLKNVAGINTEVNYEELYEGCALIDQLDEFLEKHDFQRVATITHHPYWGDAFYVKKPLITMAAFAIARFGNQIFDYAFLRIYAKEHGMRLELPAWCGQYLFGHKERPISHPLPQVVEQETPYKLSESAILNAPEPFKNVDFIGYFQFHTQYYAQHKEYFHSLFKPVSEVEAKMQESVNRLRERGKTVVGLHLRRGDYSWASDIVPYLAIAPNKWYIEWLDGFWETLDEPVLFIASDEIENVVGDFADYNPVTAKDLGVEMPEAPFYPDFYILSQCDVLATSNSTFSFAASMLNERCKFFFRPNLQKNKLIPFDPWNSEPLLRQNPSQERTPQPQQYNIRNKCTLSVCAILKNEAPYLIEWLEFHKIVGVERFYLYNNNSTDNPLDIVQPYIESGEVIWHDWSLIPGQMPAYEHCLETYRQGSEWIAFIDLDEFLFPTEKDDLKEVLEEFYDCPAVAVNWLVFGSSGHKIRPDGLQVENFTKRGENDWEINKHIKSIVRPVEAMRPHTPHDFIYLNDRVAAIENKEPIVGPWSPTNSVQKLRINHYMTRSLQESQEKMLRGRADALDPRPWMFDFSDRNEVEDLTIQRFIPKLREAVNTIISQSRIPQILTEKWRLQTKLYQIQMELEESQAKPEQNSGGFEEFTAKLQQVQQELQPIKEELEIRRVQYNKTQQELEQTQSQLIEAQTQLQEIESAAAPLTQLAEFYLAQGQLEEAIAVCQQSLKIQPKFAPAYKTLGNVFQAQGKLDEGKSYYLRALEIQPDFAQALANLGTIHAQQQHWQEAIACYQKAIAIQPNFAGVYRNLAKVFSQIGKPDEAVECSYAALILQPETTAEEYFNLGNTLLEQGKKERAIVCYRRAIYLDPNFSDAQKKLGEIMAVVTE